MKPYALHNLILITTHWVSDFECPVAGTIHTDEMVHYAELVSQYDPRGESLPLRS